MSLVNNNMNPFQALNALNNPSGINTPLNYTFRPINSQIPNSGLGSTYPPNGTNPTIGLDIPNFENQNLYPNLYPQQGQLPQTLQQGNPFLNAPTIQAPNILPQQAANTLSQYDNQQNNQFNTIPQDDTAFERTSEINPVTGEIVTHNPDQINLEEKPPTTPYPMGYGAGLGGAAVGTPSYYAQNIGRSIATGKAIREGQFDDLSPQAQQRLRRSNIVNGAVSGIGGALSLVKEGLTGAGQAKRDAFIAQSNRERLRQGQLDDSLGRQSLFNNGYLQYYGMGYEDGGKIQYLEDGGMSGLMSGRNVTGIPDDSSAISQVNAEVEKGEYIKYPDGVVSKVEGDLHKEGGEKMFLPEGTKIISRNILLNKEDVKFLEGFKIKATTKNSYAQVMDKFEKKSGILDLKKEQEKYFDMLEKNQEVKDDKTQEVNEEFISKNIYEKEQQKNETKALENFFFDIIFEKQEARKAADDTKKKRKEETSKTKSGNNKKSIAYVDGKTTINIPVFFQDGGIYTDTTENMEFYKKWAVSKGFKSMQEASDHVKKSYFQEGGEQMVEQQSQLQPSQQQEQIVQMVVQALQQGATPEIILQELIQQGIPQEQAIQLIEGVIQQMQQVPQEQGMQPQPEQFSDGGEKKKLSKYENGGLEYSDIKSYVEKLKEFEGKQGSPTGGGLSIKDFTANTKVGSPVTDEEGLTDLVIQYIDTIKEELGDAYNKLDKQSLIEILDYKINTGRRTQDLLALASGDISISDINKSNSKYELPEDISKITPNRIRQARSQVYRSYPDKTAYEKSWADRVNYLDGLFGNAAIISPSGITRDGDYDPTIGVTDVRANETFNTQSKNKFFYGDVDEAKFEEVKRNNPWFDWDSFDKTKMVKNDKGELVSEATMEFQKQYNELAKKYGKPEVTVDGKFGNQTASIEAGWLKPEEVQEIVEEKAVEEETTAPPIEPEKKLPTYNGSRAQVGHTPLSLINQNPLPPDPLQSHFFNLPRLARISPIKVSPEEAIVQNNRLQNQAFDQISQNVGSQQGANIANTIGQVAINNNQAVTDANRQNAQYKFQADQINLQQGNAEAQLQDAALKNFDELQLTALDKTNNARRHFYDTIINNRVNARREALELAIHDTMNPNYAITGNGVVFTGDPNPQINLPQNAVQGQYMNQWYQQPTLEQQLQLQQRIPQQGAGQFIMTEDQFQRMLQNRTSNTSTT